MLLDMRGEQAGQSVAEVELPVFGAFRVVLDDEAFPAWCWCVEFGHGAGDGEGSAREVQIAGA